VRQIEKRCLLKLRRLAQSETTTPTDAKAA
jgi:DNA-directed RNA polymerase sigma subunit (sigma70/sigma32)